VKGRLPNGDHLPSTALLPSPIQLFAFILDISRSHPYLCTTPPAKYGPYPSVIFSFSTLVCGHWIARPHWSLGTPQSTAVHSSTVHTEASKPTSPRKPRNLFRLKSTFGFDDARANAFAVRSRWLHFL